LTRDSTLKEEESREYLLSVPDDIARMAWLMIVGKMYTPLLSGVLFLTAWK